MLGLQQQKRKTDRDLPKKLYNSINVVKNQANPENSAWAICNYSINETDNNDSLDHLEILDNVPDTGRPDGYAPTWDEFLRQFQEAEQGGKWITINGSHIFIKDGQTITDALAEQKAIRDRLSGKSQMEQPQPPQEPEQPQQQQPQQQQPPQQQPPQQSGSYADAKELYDAHSGNYPMDNSKESMEVRKNYWANSDDDNKNLSKAWREGNSAKSMVDYYNTMLEKNIGDREKNQQHLQDEQNKQASYETQYAELKQKLEQSGRLEPERVGFNLQMIDELNQSLARRKKGSMPYHGDMIRKMRLEHDNDIIRTMTDPHPDAYQTYDDKISKEKEKKELKQQNDAKSLLQQLDPVYKQKQEQARQEFEAQKAKATKEQQTLFDSSKAILTKFGIDIDKDDSPTNDIAKQIKDLAPSGVNQELAKNNPAQHAANTKQLQLHLKVLLAYNQFKQTENEMSGNYISDIYAKKYAKAAKIAQWKIDNLITDHDIYGVNIYTDSKDKVRINKQIQKLKDAPKIARDIIKNVEIKIGAGERVRMALGSGRAGGYWDLHGDNTLKTFYNAKKWDYGMDKSDNTMDHEAAHAAYDEVARLTRNGEHPQLSEAFKNFNDVAERSGMTKGFKLHPYTDDYYKAHDKRRWTETHSKLRQFEVEGELDRMVTNANDAIAFADRMGVEAFNASLLNLPTYEHAKMKIELVNAYKTLMAEERKL